MVQAISSIVSAFPDPARLLREVIALRQTLREAEHRHRASIDAVHPSNRPSARNLIHYVTLRSHDLRPLQDQLSELGLSSLGRSEAHVLHSLDVLIRSLQQLAGEPVSQEPVTPDDSHLLEHNTRGLLGPRPVTRDARIMVTMPTEAADDLTAVVAMAREGMDIARINAAHDTPAVWQRMIQHVQAGEEACGRRLPIALDLAGPKLRTGPLASQPGVLRLRRHRDRLGRTVGPAFAWLGKAAEESPYPVIPLVEPAWASRRHAGETLRVVDSRGSRRVLMVESVSDRGTLVSHTRSLWLTDGVAIASRDGAVGVVRGIPEEPGALRLFCSDTLILTRDLTPARSSGEGGLHRVGCTLQEVFRDTRPGERIFFNDGKIGGVVRTVRPGELEVEITAAAVKGTRLRAGKGINLPDTALAVPALTESDRMALRFACENVDLVNYSFVQHAEDVHRLIDHLDADGGRKIGIVLKIETLRAYRNLPQLLLAAMRRDNAGVMIARGDLAVELGFERLAEVQEEILWLCEAAHLPVIWATEVLDRLARTGLPSRAEVTDAAMSERAECVMLNKGPYILDAIRLLDGILERMQDHANKKRSLLRPLTSWTLDE